MFQLRRSRESLSNFVSSARSFKKSFYDSGYLSCKEWWNCISDLRVLLRAVSAEEIVIREGLEARRLPHCEAPTLRRVVVDVVVSVLGNMAYKRRLRLLSALNSETVRG